MNIKKPQVEVSVLSEDCTDAVLKIKNLPPTKGTTLGNVISRGMITSPVLKPYYFVMEEVTNEFSSVSFIMEDVDKIKINISKLLIPPLPNYEDGEQISYSFDGELDGKLYAHMLKPNREDLGLPVNGNLVILETVQQIPINITITVVKGVGVLQPPKAIENTNKIYMPAVFSGMRVTSKVEPEQATETLILTISHSGEYDIQEAFTYASDSMIAYLTLLSNTMEMLCLDQTDEREEHPATADTCQIRRVSLEELDLPTDVYDRLKLDFNTVLIDGKIVKLPPMDKREEVARKLEEANIQVEIINQ